MILLSGIAAATDSCYNDCTNGDFNGCCVVECRSPGYWKNHPEAWPVNTITIGGVTYTKEEAICYMKMPVKGDKTITMFKALVSAKLNEANGCTVPDCI